MKLTYTVIGKGNDLHVHFGCILCVGEPKRVDGHIVGRWYAGKFFSYAIPRRPLRICQEHANLIESGEWDELDPWLDRE